MALPNGLAAQLGLKTESTPGTAVTVDTFPLGFVSENLTVQYGRIDSSALRAGRQVLHSWKAGATRPGGSFEVELWDDDIATLLTHCFGSVSTSGAGPYTHTYSPGDLTGQSFSLQVGLPDVGGTVRTKNFAGTKVSSWELSCAVDEIARLSVNVVAMSAEFSTSLATASYATGSAPFVFTEGQIDIGGSENTTVRSVSLSGDNNISDRVRLNSATSQQPLQAGPTSYTGQLTADFEDLTHWNRVVNGTEAALVLTFDNGTDSLTITTNARFDADTPQVSGPEILEQPLSFVCTHATADSSAFQAVLVNGEASAA